jgi:hypothetical protein
LLSSPELPTRLFDAPPNACANICHGTTPANTKSGYGTPSDGSFAMRPKSTVNNTIDATG